MSFRVIHLNGYWRVKIILVDGEYFYAVCETKEKAIKCAKKQAGFYGCDYIVEEM